MHRDLSRPAVGAPSRFRRLTLIALPLAVLAACSPDDILEVEDIDVANPASVEDSTALPSLLAGAIGDYGAALNGGGDFNQVTLSGSLSDELINTETFPTRIEVDIRRSNYTNNGSINAAFYAIQQARFSADFASAAYEKFSTNDVGHAEALNIGALSYIVMAENYCGAVPISRQTSPGVFEFGEAQTTAELLEVAVRKADSALAISQSTAAGTGSAAAKATQGRLARIVKARALLGLDRPAEAAEAIGGTAGVPTNFQYIYKHAETTGRQNNGTWATTISVSRFGVAEQEGTNGLPFRSEGLITGTVKDPRVPSFQLTGRNARGFDNVTPAFRQNKYSKRDTLTIVADGVEARLIEAEAALRAGNYSGAGGTLEILNALRADASLARLRGYVDANQQPITLPALAAAGSQAEQENQLFKERAYWMFLTSHRLGDMRRLVKFYGRGAETVFPTGSYHKPGTYGTDVNIPIPQSEDNNPNFTRASCDVSEA